MLHTKGDNSDQSATLIKDIESQLKEAQDNLEIAKNKWAKEEVEWKQRLEQSLKEHADEKKKYEEMLQQRGDQSDQSATLIKDMESQLKETKENFESAKENWTKEEAILKQKLEETQRLHDEGKQKLEDILKSKDDQGDQSATLIKEIESELKDTKLTLDTAKENWAKEETDLKQKLNESL